MFIVRVLRCSEVDWLSVCGHAGLLEGLCESWMRVACSGNVFGRSSILKSNNCFVNHLTCVATDNPGSQELVCFGARKNLDHAIWLVVGPRTTVSLEWEHTFDVLNALLFEFLFGLADVGDLWVRVDDAWDGSIVDVASLAAKMLDGSDAFFLGLVGEHGSRNDISDGVDVWLAGLPVVVDVNLAPLVGSEAGLGQVETVGEWLPANTEKDDIGFQVLLSLRILNHEFDSLSFVILAADELGAAHELQSLFSEHFLEGSGHLLVKEWANALSELDDLNLGSKPLVN